MRRLLDRRTLGGAFLFAVVAALLGVSTACNSSAAPSGSESKAANNVKPGGGGGGGGGGGTPGTALRLIAFESGAVFNSSNGPVLGAAGEVWCFVTSNTGTATTGAVFAAPTFTINGAAEPTTFADVLSLANPPPATANGWFCVLTPANIPANGTLIASSSLGSSNAVTMSTAAFPAGNTAAGGFTISSPVDAFIAGYTQQPTAAAYNFALTSPSGVSAYFSFTLVLDRTNGGTLVANAVERATPGALTAGSATNVSRAYLNTALPPLNVPANASSTVAPQVYTYQIVPLSSTGWGVGSSIDAALAQWIWFGVQ